LFALAVALPAGLVTVVTSGPAAGARTPPFVGAATGKVTCTGINVKVKFTPPLTFNTGGNSFTLAGKLTGCTNPSGPDAITSGKITGSSVGAGGGCAGLIAGSPNPVKIDIKWKGTHNSGKAKFSDTGGSIVGAVPATSGAGNVGFTLPQDPAPAANGNLTGSFASAGPLDQSTIYSTLTTTQLGATCAKTNKKGVYVGKIRTLKLVSGAITLP
jgi:hypothetical protein